MKFYDDHVHFLWYGLTLIRPDLSKAQSLEDLKNIIKESLNNPMPFMWAEGWDESDWDKPQVPTKDFLDEITGDIPYIIRRVCGHKGVANSAALEYLQKNNLTEGVNFETGIIEEGVILHLSDYIIPSEKEVEMAIKEAEKKFKSLNIYGFTDFISYPFFKRLIDYKEEIPFEINTYIIGEEGKEFIGYKKDNITVKGLKFFADGSIGSHTAAVSKPYKNTDNYGTLLLNKEEISRIIIEAKENNYTVAIHAIGDRAIDEIIEGVKLANIENPPLRIEHFEISKDYHIEFVKERNIHISVQPNFIVRWGMPGGMYENNLDDELYKIHNRIPLYIEKGLKMKFGSDCMPPGPKWAIENLHYNIDKNILYKYYI